MGPPCRNEADGPRWIVTPLLSRRSL